MYIYIYGCVYIYVHMCVCVYICICVYMGIDRAALLVSLL